MLSPISTGFDALPSFDRINLGSTLLQSAVIIAFAAAQFGAARHFGRPAMRQMAIVWRLFAYAAFVNIFSSWAGAIWENRPLSRALTSVLVGLLAAAIPHARLAVQHLALPEHQEASLPRDGVTPSAVRWGVGICLLHALLVFGSAAWWPTQRVVTVTASRAMELAVLLLPVWYAWHGVRVATRNRAALELLAVALTGFAFRQAIAVALGLRVGLPDMAFSTVVVLIVVDILAVMLAGVSTLLATTTEEVSLMQAKSQELAQTQERLAAASRMESLGRMAAGVAHDINNVLQVIGLTTDELRSHASTNNESTSQMDAAVSHARSLTSQLLTFARTRPASAEQFDPSVRLEGIRALLSAMVGTRLEISVAPSVQGTHLMMDPAQFEQLIINLVSNARDAIGVDGRVRVQLDLIGVNASTPNADALNPGNYVRILVEDSGPGISPDIRAQIFEPFFTTKPAGKGTGLGLATVHGIARQASGTVRLESAPGQGTTFEVLLPAA